MIQESHGYHDIRPEFIQRGPMLLYSELTAVEDCHMTDLSRARPDILDFASFLYRVRQNLDTLLMIF